jgi:hypothetical protein
MMYGRRWRSTQQCKKGKSNIQRFPRNIAVSAPYDQECVENIICIFPPTTLKLNWLAREGSSISRVNVVFSGRLFGVKTLQVWDNKLVAMVGQLTGAAPVGQ